MVALLEKVNPGIISPDFQETPFERVTFGEYADMAFANPLVAQLAHARVYHAIVDTPDIFAGINASTTTLQDVRDYFASSGRDRMETRKRLLMFVGDPNNAQAITTRICVALEAHSQTPNGAAYAIKGCPINEEPFHLTPESLRAEIAEQYGVYIEGGLCSDCQTKLTEKYAGYAHHMPVTRMVFSQTPAVGIGRIDLRDPDNQDITKITGRYVKEKIDGVLTFVLQDPGLLRMANRGLVVFDGLLAAPASLTFPLLTLAQEQMVRLPKDHRAATTDLDLVLIAHATGEEYNAFANIPRNEALKDRMFVIPIR